MTACVRRLARAGLAFLCLTVAARGDVTLIGVARVPGDATDKSGLRGRYTNADGQSIPADQWGSFGSAIDYTGAGNRYIAVNDRGFGDGTSASADRFHVVEIVADPAQHKVDVRLVSTTLLTDEAGRPLVGQASAFSTDPALNLRFDPEGLRLAQDRAGDATRSQFLLHHFRNDRLTLATNSARSAASARSMS